MKRNDAAGWSSWGTQVAAALAGCNAILGIGDPSLGGGGGEGGAATGGTSATGGAATGMGAGGTGPGGGGGEGGAGGSPATCDGCTGVREWSRGWGTSGRTYGTAVAVAADGAVFVAGRSNGTVDFGSGALSASGDGFSIVLAKLVEDGTLAWAK